MSFDTLLGELQAMFQYRRFKMTTRKKFKDRIWKRDEYVHEKIIMGNRVSIDGGEMLEYIVDGIPDNTPKSGTHSGV